MSYHAYNLGIIGGILQEINRLLDFRLNFNNTQLITEKYRVSFMLTRYQC